ncbi:hypothetical protein JCM3770_001708 [Rhodotorula araucariae]
MPFSSRNAASTRSRPAATVAAPCSPSAAPSTARPRRKSAPHKSPARSSPARSSTSAPSPTSPGAAPPALDARALLRLLVREGARPASSLDNRRFRPSAAGVSPSKGGAGAAQQQKKRIGSRDALPPPLVGYGRGRRATSTALAGIFAAEGEADGGGNSAHPARGRSPGAAAAARRGASVGSVGGGRARAAVAAAHPYAPPPPPPQYPYYAAPPAEYPPNRMARAVSLVSPVYYPVATVAGPSPLARSFSAGGDPPSAARVRTPGGTGVARVVELGGHVGPPGKYQAIAA